MPTMSKVLILRSRKLGEILKYWIEIDFHIHTHLNKIKYGKLQEP